MLYSLRSFGRDEVAMQRMKIIRFYEQYGEKATKEAFGADGKVISRWRKRLEEGNGQSDNGKENLGEVDYELKRGGIPHYFSYPHCPKINAYIERYNGTLQEEFIDNNLDIIHDKALFSQELADYLIFYNTERPHKSLGLKSPLEYLIENGGMSQKSLTYTGTCIIKKNLLW